MLQVDNGSDEEERRMKIGEFSKMYQVSKDTLRYYVSIGLLSPRMQGSQMNFSEREERDFKHIQKLKEMRFNIKEIRSFLYFQRVSNMIEPSTLDQCLELLREKRETLLEEEKQIHESIAMIDQETAILEAKKNLPVQQARGIPLSAVALLACPDCGAPLSIENASISKDSIYSGQLSCSCGFQAHIEDGILKTGIYYTGTHDQPDLTRCLYHDTGEEWVIHSAKCTDFMLEEVKKRNLSGKVILEANVNGFFFVYNFLQVLPKDCLYVIVDKYEEVLAMYKQYIEMLHPEMRVLYIADASEQLPLKKNSVDYNLTLFGENEYSLYHADCQAWDLKEILKPEAEIIGAVQSFPVDSVSRKNLIKKYPEGSRRRMNMDYMKQDYAKAGFLLHEKLLGTVTKTLKHHMYTCHVDGEPLELYGFTAVRNRMDKEK